MKKKFKLAGLVIVVAACITGIYYYWSSEDERARIAEIDSKTSSEVQDEIEKSFTSQTPQATKEKYETFSEGQLIQEVHDMSHQKVHADQKWGASEITEDKVLLLIEAIKSTQFEKESTKDMLLATLESWSVGNFSNAVKDHNLIWAYQKGNVGKATRLLTPQEELQYIEEKFR
ncbi:DUF6241 domain-containing protein [Neobacillus sp. K501]